MDTVKGKKWIYTLLILKENELLDLSKGGAQSFIAKRLWFSAEFAVAVTAWLAHCSMHRDRDCRKATH